MDDDKPFFLKTFDSLEPEYKNHIWRFTLLGGVFVGKVVWLVRDAYAHPIMVSVDRDIGGVVEIPWTAIQCITYEGTKSNGS